MEDRDALNEFWTNEPHIIRGFLDRRTNYDKLAEEIAYILTKAVRVISVEYSAITSRVKSLNSFCNKIVRKTYRDPLTEITDIAGVRIVYLYPSDRHKIETIIEKEFSVIEKIDKIAEADNEHFGYGAVHYVVRLGGKATGARYDDLKDLACEIQVRTILQDAWAIVAHHLSYKQESDVPKTLRRKLNALSGLFETADDQFNRLNEERSSYRNSIAQKIKNDTPTILKQDINLDNLSEYFAWKLPNREMPSKRDAAELRRELTKAGYIKIGQIDDAINKAMPAILEYENDDPPFDEYGNNPTEYSCTGVTRVALELIDDEFLCSRGLGKKHTEEIRSYRHFLTK